MCNMNSKISTVFCCFFFFQAEDGIRDRTVTGVQTCALPICRCRRCPWRGQEVATAGRDVAGGAGPRQGQRLHRHAGVQRERLQVGTAQRSEIGRASCRERGEEWGGAGEGRKKRTSSGEEERV